MKNYLVALLLFIPMIAGAQGRIYTKKARMEDFSSRTTKVVLDGDIVLASHIKEAVEGVWNLSAYEFCTAQEYESLKADNRYYFLRPVEVKGTVTLILSKGGLENSGNSLTNSFELVRMPVGGNYEHLPALVSIIQCYVEDSLMSEAIAYSGLKHYNKQGKKAVRALKSSDPDRLVTISAGGWSIIYDRDSYELYSYRKD